MILFLFLRTQTVHIESTTIIHNQCSQNNDSQQKLLKSDSCLICTLEHEFIMENSCKLFGNVKENLPEYLYLDLDPALFCNYVSCDFFFSCKRTLSAGKVCVCVCLDECVCNGSALGDGVCEQQQAAIDTLICLSVRLAVQG